MLPESAPDPLPVIHEEIDADKAALNLQGSGGPSLMGADGWRHMLCSEAYGNASTNLCQSIADLAKNYVMKKFILILYMNLLLVV